MGYSPPQPRTFTFLLGLSNLSLILNDECFHSLDYGLEIRCIQKSLSQSLLVYWKFQGRMLLSGREALEFVLRLARRPEPTWSNLSCLWKGQRSSKGRRSLCLLFRHRLPRTRRLESAHWDRRRVQEKHTSWHLSNATRPLTRTHALSLQSHPPSPRQCEAGQRTEWNGDTGATLMREGPWHSGTPTLTLQSFVC